MTGKSIKVGAPKSVPQLSVSADFVPGSRPDTLYSPRIPRVKPDKPSTREYGKAPAPPKTPSPFGGI